MGAMTSFPNVQTLTEEELKHALSIAKDLILTHGIIKRTRVKGVSALPVTLLPTPFPYTLFQLSTKIQPDFNSLMHQVAFDDELLYSIFPLILDQDPFLANLWSIYKEVKNDPNRQKVVLGLNRSDYMANISKDVTILKQVEFNMMASSFCGVMPQVRQFHSEMMNVVGLPIQNNERIPENLSAEGFAKAMLMCRDLYAEQVQPISSCALSIVFIIDEEEENIFDQRHLERALYRQESNVHVQRISMHFLCNNPEKWLLTPEKRLFINNMEVCLIYFRYGYAPDHFPDDKTWNVKLKLEMSRAIKCPCIQYMLANTKLVQASLTKPKQLQRYKLSDEQAYEVIKQTFARQLTLSPLLGINSQSEIDEAVADAMQNKDKYVLKPQREGGRNNYFGDEMVQMLNKIIGTSSEMVFVLMERLCPYPYANCILREPLDEAESAKKCDVVGEFGVFGSFIASDDVVHLNQQCGHLLRSKVVGTDEGGIAAGYACLDSPFLL